MKISVLPLGRDSPPMEVEVPNTVTVKALKKEISRKLGTSAGDLRLSYLGRALDEDEKTLSSYGISDKAIVNIVETPPGGGLLEGVSLPPTLVEVSPDEWIWLSERLDSDISEALLHLEKERYEDAMRRLDEISDFSRRRIEQYQSLSIPPDEKPKFSAFIDDLAAFLDALEDCRLVIGQLKEIRDGKKATKLKSHIMEHMKIIQDGLKGFAEGP